MHAVEDGVVRAIGTDDDLRELAEGQRMTGVLVVTLTLLAAAGLLTVCRLLRVRPCSTGS